MKMIKRYAGILMMLTLLVGFTSCEDDEDIYDDYDGRPAGDLPFRWWVDYGTLYLDYGRDFALREIRGVRVRGRYLQGDLYLDGEYIDYIELQMQ